MAAMAEVVGSWYGKCVWCLTSEVCKVYFKDVRSVLRGDIVEHPSKEIFQAASVLLQWAKEPAHSAKLSKFSRTITMSQAVHQNLLTALHIAIASDEHYICRQKTIISLDDQNVGVLS